MIVLIIVSWFFLKLFGAEGEGRFYFILIFFLAGGLIAVFNYGSEETVLSCFDNHGIEFYKNNPSKAELNTFLHELFLNRNRVLKEKYGFVSEYITFEDQYQRVNLLHTLGIINLEEFDQLKKQLNELVERDKDTFKFKQN